MYTLNIYTGQLVSTKYYHTMSDLTEIADTFRHSVSLLSFNKVCEIIVHLANSYTPWL